MHFYRSLLHPPLRATILATLISSPFSPGAAQRNATVPPVDSVALGTRVISLNDAIALAQKNAPQNIAARGAEVTGQAAVRSAYGAFVPSLSASTGASRTFTGGSNSRTNSNGEVVGVQDQWSYSNGYSLNAELLNLNRVPNLRAAKATLEAAKHNSAAQRYTTALAIAEQYFTALAARESEDAARIQLDQAQQQLAAARRRVEAGASTASDSLTATVQVASAKLAVLTAQNNRRNANAALTRLVGSTSPLSAQIDDPAVLALDTIPVDSATIVAFAQRSPTVTQARAQLTAAHARRQAAKAAYYPTLNAGYSRGGNGRDSRFGFGNDPFSYTGQLSFSLSIPLFDQFSRSAQVASATVSEDNAAATLRDSQLEAQQLAIQYLGSLKLGREQVATQTASVTAAEENLRVQQQRYDLRLSTIVDLLTAQTTLTQARADLITARNVVRLSIAQLQALAGQPLSALTVRPSGVTQ